MMERLQKILSQAGVASRRASEQLMLEGRVTVNGVTIRELGTKADPSRDDIRVDGRRVKLPEHHRYLLLNKPRGYLTTRSDPQGRSTVLDLLHAVHEYVYPVGRLDFDSEGLLLLTNDGALAARLTHPRHGIPRVYEARVLGVPDAHELDQLARGVVIDGRRTAPAEIRVLSPAARPSSRPHARAERPQPRAKSGGISSSRESAFPPRRGGAQRGGRGNTTSTVLRITVHEGRHRQVRKMCEAIGHPVTDLKRVAIGPIRDQTLKPGQWRELTAKEVERLRAATDRRSERTTKLTRTTKGTTKLTKQNDEAHKDEEEE